MKRIWINSFDINLKSALRNLKSAILLGAMLFALCLPAGAQQPKKVPRIGFLMLVASPSAREAFRHGLNDLGYIEGQNIVIDYRHADVRSERLPGLAAELVRLNVALIVAAASQSALAAKTATKTIPIIFTGVGDPVAQGLVFQPCAAGR